MVKTIKVAIPPYFSHEEIIRACKDKGIPATRIINCGLFYGGDIEVDHGKAETKVLKSPETCRDMVYVIWTGEVKPSVWQQM